MPVSESVVTPTSNSCTCLCISLFREAEGRPRQEMVSTVALHTELESDQGIDPTIQVALVQDRNANSETLPCADLTILSQIVDVNLNTSVPLSEIEASCSGDELSSTDKNANTNVPPADTQHQQEIEERTASKYVAPSVRWVSCLECFSQKWFSFFFFRF